MRNTLCVVLLFLICNVAKAEPKRRVDLVLALDTSGSMDGLIDSARAKLWDVVNLLAQQRPQPVLRVGLISYGNDSHPSGAGWVRTESDLTTDLDAVYAKLFALRTNGGTEYVARAIEHAVSTMRWDQDQRTAKILFVAGNEPADQDPTVTLKRATGLARQRGVYVNTVYCGSPSSGEAAGWASVASMGNGEYASIDHNHVVAVATPMDAELARLSVELNKTYVAYGAGGADKAKNQAAQDANAALAGAPVAASRAAAKSSGVYRADDWDLVDAKARGKKMADVEAEALPAPMKAMSAPERERYVEGKAKERAALQRQIAEVSRKRDEYIAAQSKPKAGAPAHLDDAMKKAVTAQLH